MPVSAPPAVQRVSARWSIQDGQVTTACVEIHEEREGRLIQVFAERLTSKTDLSIAGLRRALRKVRLATGGAR